MKQPKPFRKKFTEWNPFLRTGLMLMVIGMVIASLGLAIPGTAGSILVITGIAITAAGGFLMSGMI